MEPLAPIVDRMRELAQDELPSPRTCRIRLWDDGTFDAEIYHGGSDEREAISYLRTTGEIVWEYGRGGRYESTSLSGGETLHEPVVDETEVRALETVEPPYE